MTQRATAYDEDFYTWTTEQAAALRREAASRVNLPGPVDLANVAEEIESLGAAAPRAVLALSRAHDPPAQVAVPAGAAEQKLAVDDADSTR